MPGTGEKSQPLLVLTRLYEEVFNQGHLEVVRELVADSFVDHIPHPLPNQPVTGPEAVGWVASQFRTAFPDLHITIEDVFGIGDRVATRTTWRGTHKGRSLILSPTGKSFSVMGLDIVRITDGKITEHWGQLDVLGVMLQFGLLPQDILPAPNV